MKPLLSVDKSEARHRVFALYKAWSRTLEPMILAYNLPVSIPTAQKVLRAKFEAQRHVKDTRVIDMLVIRVSARTSGPLAKAMHGYYPGGNVCPR